MVRTKKNKISFSYWLKKSEQKVSFVLGIVVVLVIGGLIFKYFQDRGNKEPLPISPQKEEITELSSKTELPTIYKVKAGDHLWKIAEEFYGSGYNWVDIAKENKLQNPSFLAVGQELAIPKVETKLPVGKTKIEAQLLPIEGDTYVVQQTDSLSKIALRAYGDMFAWPKIFEANKEQIKNPTLIYPGQVLRLPR